MKILTLIASAALAVVLVVPAQAQHAMGYTRPMGHMVPMMHTMPVIHGYPMQHQENRVPMREFHPQEFRPRFEPRFYPRPRMIERREVIGPPVGYGRYGGYAAGGYGVSGYGGYAGQSELQQTYVHREGYHRHWSGTAAVVGLRSAPVSGGCGCNCCCGQNALASPIDPPGDPVPNVLPTPEDYALVGQVYKTLGP